ncbi:MAG: hypothetical protein WCY63_09495, partial [Weeksellaceae bacterium]
LVPVAFYQTIVAGEFSGFGIFSDYTAEIHTPKILANESKMQYPPGHYKQNLNVITGVASC